MEITFIIIFTCGLDILFDGKVCILHSVFASLHGETLIMKTPTRLLLYFQTPKIKKFVLHEKGDGNQACPQCKTRYKRLKGKSSTNIYFHLSVILLNNATQYASIAITSFPCVWLKNFFF